MLGDSLSGLFILQTARSGLRGNLEICIDTEHSPFLILVRDEELVQLLSPEVVFVLVVLADGIRIGN